MARNGRGGLGRGLNSLLGGAYEEAIPQEEPQRVRVDNDQPQQKQPQPEREVIRETVPAQKSPEPRTARETVPSSYEEQEPESIVDNGVEVTIKGVAERAARPAVQEVVERTVVPSASAQSDGDDQPREVNEVDINAIAPNPDQPRTNFKREELEELSASIQKDGLLQPILVQDKGEYYEIIAGERRWRAAKLAGLKEVPVIIRNYSSQEIVEISLIENIQREDLNPIEEAQAYKRLLTEFNLKQDEVAERVSKSRTAVTNSMRLLKLCDGVQQMIIDDMLSTGHARALIPIEDPELQLQLAQRIFDEKLSVREVEKLVKSILKPAEEKPKKEEIPQSLMYIYQNIENKLKDKLSRKVAISPKGKNGSGKIEIEFYSNDDLEKLIEILSK